MSLFDEQDDAALDLMTEEELDTSITRKNLLNPTEFRFVLDESDVFDLSCGIVPLGIQAQCKGLLDFDDHCRRLGQRNVAAWERGQKKRRGAR